MPPQVLAPEGSPGQQPGQPQQGQQGGPPASAQAVTQQQQQQQAGAVLELLDGFQAVQRDRAAAYRRFDAAFRAYLASGVDTLYRQTISELTSRFQELSGRVRAAEASLQGLGRPDLAELLRRVQENEREKLRLTLAMHALKSAHAQGRFSWQHEEAAAAASEAAGLLALQGAHVCGVGCMHEAPPGEATQAEYSAAVKESYQLLQGVITAINDALEEVQQAAAELLEQ